MSIKYKRNTVFALINRVIKLSHANYRKENIEKCKNILDLSNYPSCFYNKIIKDKTNKIHN